MGAANPMDLMVEGLSCIARQASESNRNFVNASAGVNWRAPEESVIALLQGELALSMTTRNYGHASGTPAVTRVLESLEQRSHGCRGLAVTLTHGTTEGASLALGAWADDGRLPVGANALAIGHCFPLYHRLATERGLVFHECLGDELDSQRFMPVEPAIVDALEVIAPRLIFLLLPNNPLGEIVDAASLKRIADYVRERGARLLVDRVCLMAWDDASHVHKQIGPLVRDGLAAVCDSFSKSESLAGLRMGYLVSDPPTRLRLIEATRSRFLNPPVFGSATLALTRAASHGIKRARRYLAVAWAAHDRLYGEYPANESCTDYLLQALDLLPGLVQQTAARRKHLDDNFKRLEERFSGRVLRRLRFDAGFNVALALEPMDAHREERDYLELAQNHGVGILTSRCFCQRPTGRKYFVRIGLTLPSAQFEHVLERLDHYYHHVPRKESV